MESTINYKAWTIEADGDGLVIRTKDGHRFRFQLTVDLIDDLESVHEELSGDLTPFLNEDMTIAEVAVIFNDTAQGIIDTICAYSYR